MPKLQDEIIYSTPDELVSAIHLGSNFSLHEESYMDSILQFNDKFRYHERGIGKQEDNFPKDSTIITIPPPLLKSPLKKGNHPDHKPHSVIWYAIACGNKPALKVILATDHEMANLCTEFDEHPIVQAVAMNSTEMADILLKNVNFSLECNSRDIALLQRLLKKDNKPDAHYTRNVGVMVLTILQMQRKKEKLIKQIVNKMVENGCYTKEQLYAYLEKRTPLPLPSAKSSNHHR